MSTTVAAAEAALRYNIRPLTPRVPESLRHALARLDGAGDPEVLTGDAALGALGVEGLHPDQVGALRRAVEAEGGRAVIAPDGRAVLLGPSTSLAGAARRLAAGDRTTADLGAALAAALAGRHPRPALRCGERRLELGASTLIMGVVNATPDSFSGDGVAGDVGAAVALAERLVADGADLIDVGGESTRPGSAPVNAPAELRRVLPVLEALAGRLPVPVSVDTRKAGVARAAIAAGATMVNDVWGLRGDPQMAPVLAAHPEVALVAMHNRRGHGDGDLMAEVARDLRESLLVAARHGIDDGRLVLDPGFGFGKTPAQNLELLQRWDELGGLGCPLLLGPSRKSTIGLVLGGAPPDQRVEGTLALCVIAVAAGVEMVRVHDVAAVRRGLRVADAVLRRIPEAVRLAPSPGPTG
ncbi:MAG: dihydropteroate synthase [Candidatus Dormibacteria bacterium]